ncbi:hypothetical protein QEM13_004377 [Pseudomonas putida]|nr:hypothetical protein [Pseudomonas putida]
MLIAGSCMLVVVQGESRQIMRPLGSRIIRVDQGVFTEDVVLAPKRTWGYQVVELEES